MNNALFRKYFTAQDYSLDEPITVTLARRTNISPRRALSEARLTMLAPAASMTVQEPAENHVL